MCGSLGWNCAAGGDRAGTDEHRLPAAGERWRSGRVRWASRPR